MHEIEILLVSRWKELEYDLVHNHHSRVELHNYLSLLDYPCLPSENHNVYWKFLDVWDEIRSFCNPEMAKNIETAFFVEWEPFDWKKQEWRRRKDDLPLNQILKMPHSGVWALVTCSLGPESVRNIAKVTEQFDLDSYLVHFEPHSPPDNFPDKQALKIYSEIWLNHFNLAASNDAGIVILRT